MIPPPVSRDRHIRVFISSTFRDMQEERDLLVKVIFPQLRKMCEERSVVWTEVDLRWGITDEQQAEGKVLPLCLAEIQRCRPYFIGLLGERYGWVPEPESIPGDLLESQPWLNRNLQQSVTELEILHGVFAEGQMHGHAYFYFRDPAYLGSVPSAMRRDFAGEDQDAATKLAALKQKIRAARDEQVCHLREPYADPRQLGDWILEDLGGLIDRLFPQDEAPDPLAIEAARHEAYARNRRLAFVGREDLLHRLDVCAATAGGSLVLTGESGCGKSALLAEWVARRRESHPDELIIQHYIGSTAGSAEWQGLVRRVLGELKRAFAITDGIPLGADALLGALRDWSAKASGARPVVVVLDALNQLSAESAARQLGWLPDALPANFRVIASTLPGESLEALQRRDWPVVEVPLFASPDVVPTARAYFAVFSKTLPESLAGRLEATPAACNALYLRAVLDELRQFGIHEELAATAKEYLSAADPAELFDRILSRWDRDFGSDPAHPDLVRRTLRYLACSRYGLSETELLALLGDGGEPMPRRPWTPFYLAAESALAQRSGLLDFGHDYLRVAVQQRWLADSEAMRDVRLELAEFHRRSPGPTDRQLDEVPWLLSQAGEWDELAELLTDAPAFLRLREDRWKWDLHRYWLALQQFRPPVDAYERAFPEWEAWLTRSKSARFRTMACLAEFHQDRGEYGAAESWLRRATEACLVAQGPWATESVILLSKLGNLLHVMGNQTDAEPLLRQVVEINERQLGPQDPFTLASINNLAAFLESAGKYEDAGNLYHRCLPLHEQVFGADHPETLTCVNNVANLMVRMGHSADAGVLYERAQEGRIRVLGREHPDTLTSMDCWGGALMDREAYRQAESVFRRVHETRERVLGADHPDTLITINNLASALRSQGNFAAAEPLFRQALAVWERTDGATQPHAIILMDNLAALLMDRGDYRAAEVLSRRALATSETTLGKDHPTTIVCVAIQAALLQEMGDYRNAEVMFRRALESSERVLGPEHPNTLTAMNNLATLLALQGDIRTAEGLYRQALEIETRLAVGKSDSGPGSPGSLAGLNLANLSHAESEERLRLVIAAKEAALGPDHPTTLTMVSNLAVLLKQKKDYAAAEPLQRRVLATRARVLGPIHPDTLASAQNLALLRESMEDTEEAESLFRESLKFMEDVLGPEHPHTLDALANLATLLARQGQHAAAEPLYRRALDASVRLLGESHPTSLACLDSLAASREAARDFPSAEPLYRQVLRIKEKVDGMDHTATILAVNNLARTLNSAGNYQAAESLYRRALAAMERDPGPDHENTTAVANNLAAALCGQEKYDEAEPLHRRVLERHERLHGPDHPLTLICLDNLAGLLAAKGDDKAAEKLHRRALATLERVAGPDHPDTLTALNNLALLHYRTGDFAATEELLWRALDGLDRVLGPEHTNTLRTLDGLIYSLAKQGSSEKLAPLLERKLSRLFRLSKEAGEHHPDLQPTFQAYKGVMADLDVSQENFTARVNALCQPFGMQLGGGTTPEPPELGQALELHGQAATRCQEGDYAGAKSLLIQSIALWEHAKGPNDLQLATMHFEMAAIERALENPDGEEQSLRRSLAISEKGFGPDQESTLTVLMRLVIALVGRGNYAEAEQLQRRLHRAQVHTLGESHPDTLSAQSILGGLLLRLGRLAEAEAQYKQALAAARLALGIGHELTGRIRASLEALEDTMRTQLQEKSGITADRHAAMAEQLERDGNLRQAVVALSESALAEVRRYGEEHPRATAAMGRVARVLQRLGEPAEAERMLRQIITTEDKILPADSPRHPNNLNNLAIVLILQGRAAEAAECVEQAWSRRSAPDVLTSARIMAVSFAAEVLAGKTPDVPLGRLKTLLSGSSIASEEWDVRALLDHTKLKLRADSYNLLATIVGVLDGSGKLTELANFPVWREASPLPLD